MKKGIKARLFVFVAMMVMCSFVLCGYARTEDEEPDEIEELIEQIKKTDKVKDSYYAYEVIKNDTDNPGPGTIIAFAYRNGKGEGIVPEYEMADEVTYAKGVFEVWYTDAKGKPAKLLSEKVDNFVTSCRQEYFDPSFACDINGSNINNGANIAEYISDGKNAFLYVRILPEVLYPASYWTVSEAEDKTEMLFDLSGKKPSECDFAEEANGWKKVTCEGQSLWVGSGQIIDKKEYDHWKKLADKMNKETGSDISVLDGGYADYDGDGKGELFAAYAEADDEDGMRIINVAFANDKKAEILDSMEDYDLYYEKDFGEACESSIYNVDGCVIFAISTSRYSYVSQQCYTVEKGEPVCVLEETEGCTPVLCRVGGKYIFDVNETGERRVKESGKWVDYELYSHHEYPVAVKNKKLGQIASVEISIDDFCDIPEALTSLAKIKNDIRYSDFILCDNGNLVIEIEIEDVDIDSILYNEAGYYVMNVTCKGKDIDTGEPSESEMYVRFTFEDGIYCPAEIQAGHVKAQFDGCEVVKTSRWSGKL